MTRIEEIVHEAKHREKEKGFTQIVRDTKGLYSAYGIGFLEGAEWADKTMIDNVCEWLENHNDYQRVLYSGKGVRFDMTQCVFDLRKAMEE